MSFFARTLTGEEPTPDCSAQVKRSGEISSTLRQHFGRVSVRRTVRALPDVPGGGVKGPCLDGGADPFTESPLDGGLSCAVARRPLESDIVYVSIMRLLIFLEGLRQHIYLYGQGGCAQSVWSTLSRPVWILAAVTATAMEAPAVPKPQALTRDGITLHGWTISTQKGPIIADRDTDAFR